VTYGQDLNHWADFHKILYERLLIELLSNSLDTDTKAVKFFAIIGR
jgi:hypothetical protein